MDQTKQDILKWWVFSRSIHSLEKVHIHKVLSIFLFAHLQKALKKWCKLGKIIPRKSSLYPLGVGASDDPKKNWWPLNLDSHEFDCLSSLILPKKAFGGFAISSHRVQRNIGALVKLICPEISLIFYSLTVPKAFTGCSDPTANLFTKHFGKIFSFLTWPEVTRHLKLNLCWQKGISWRFLSPMTHLERKRNAETQRSCHLPLKSLLPLRIFSPEALWPLQNY